MTGFIHRRIVSIFCVLAAIAAAADMHQVAPSDVLRLLNATIAWNEHVENLSDIFSQRDVLLENSLHQLSAQAVRQGFDFAKAQAALLAKKKPSAPGQTPNGQLSQALSDANERVSRLQGQIDSLDAEIPKATARSRDTLANQRNTLAANLVLAKEFQSTIQSVISFSSAPDTVGGGALSREINSLAQNSTVAVALGPSSAQAAHAAAHAASSPQVFHPETAGIAALITQEISVARDQSRIKAVVSETKSLIAEIDDVRAPIRTALRAILSEADNIAKATDTQTDPVQLEDLRKKLGDLSTQFKRQVTVIEPLSQQGITLNSAVGTLAQLSDVLGEESHSVMRFFFLRAGVLGGSIFVVFLASEIIRRSTVRYVRDPRRRRQFSLVRRVMVGISLTFLITVTFLSGFGSVATVAGFVTAGLAVALQNVILSVVAYFFLIGKYGLRVGNQITVAGVTGQVLEVGFVRLYLMESATNGSVFHSTGRIAVFPNSIIFQPSALMKQAPGAEYAWHMVSLQLVGDCPIDVVRDRISNAVEAVYLAYRVKIEQQHVSLERNLNVQIPVPQLLARVQPSEAGCDVSIRYPVEMDPMSSEDDRIVQSILAELDKEPKLQLAPGGAPKTKAVV